MKNLLTIILCTMTIVMVSCEKANTKLEVTPGTVSLYANGTKQLTTTPSTGVTFSSEDKFYAEVSSDGLVKANKVGRTNIKVTSKNQTSFVPVTIMPKYTLYPELESIVGAPVSKMTSILGTNYKQGITSSGDISYTYAEYNNYTYGIVCTFKNGVCNNIGTIVSTTYLNQFCDYLIERYTVAGMQNDYYFFLDHDQKTIISMTLYNAYYMMAIYIPYSGSKASEVDYETVVEELRSIEL